ncbi:sulfatase family protein [Niabella aquatica]
MKRICILKMTLLLLLPLLKAAGQQHPNIVIIMADDLGYGDFSSYGASKIKTPAIDALAAAGMRFTDAHTASSLCSPSRYSIMTGRYSWRTSLKSGVLTWFAQPLIEPGRTTLAALLKRNGYYTACIGKWHLGFNWPLKDTVIEDPQQTVFNSWERTTQAYIDFSRPVTGGPLEKGFDYYFGISASNNMLPFTFIENDHVLSAPVVPRTYVYDTDQPIAKAPEWDLEKMDQVLTAKAVGVIDHHFSQKTKTPLFLYFPTSAIHRPCLPTFTKGKSGAGLRGDMVLEFDWVVDEVVKALKRNKAFDNTLLIITSDNGAVPGDAVVPLERYRSDWGDKYYLPYFNNYQPHYQNPEGRGATQKGWLTYDHASAGPYRGFKSDAWEGGHRVPLIMHWSKNIKAGTVNSHMVCNTDLMATVADIIKSPLKSGEGEDSYSYLSAILDPAAKQARTSMVLAAGGSGAYIVRQGSWKYIEGGNAAWGQTFYAGGPFTKDFQLYDLERDPAENENLFTRRPEKVALLKNILQKAQTTDHSERNP